MFSLFSHIPTALNAESEDRRCWAAAAELKADPCPERPWEGSSAWDHYIPCSDSAQGPAGSDQLPARKPSA